MKIAEIITEACWTGYHKEGMKTMFGKQYPNCVKNKKKKSKNESTDVDVEESTTDRYLSATEKVKNISPVLTRPYGSAKQTALMKNFFGGS